MFDHFYAVIMAGGSGTRLWPLSRKDRPKQSLVIGGERTLFQSAVDRLEGLFPFERILVVTIAEQVEQLRTDCPEIPLENYVIEPLPRGTASVVALAAIAIKHRDPEGVMAVLTADHLIGNQAHFQQLLQAAHETAQDDYLVTLGITPNYPATGFGYIQKGEQIRTAEGLDVFSVQKFKEKPDLALAQEMVSDGQHVWNSGMFIWKVTTVMAEIERQMPELFGIVQEIEKTWATSQQDETVQSLWPTIKPQTIDYGIMENARKVAVIPSIDLGWNDVGSWESLFEALNYDSDGNIRMHENVVTFDTQGTLICEDSPDRLIVTVGVKDLIIIDSGNALLVCDRKNAQQVREVVNYLKEHGRVNYL